MCTDNSSKQLADQIANAFPSPFRFSHEQCLEIRKLLFSSKDDEVLNLLGPVLVDLVMHHSRSSCEPATADSVVRFFASVNPPPLETIPGKQLDTSSIEDLSRAQQAESELLFNKFSKEQASAITEWLLAALSWHEPHLHDSEIRAALDYWSKPR